MAALTRVRDHTDAELLAMAGSEMDPVTMQFTANPLFITGRMAPGKLGGMIFDDTGGTEGGAQIKFYTLAEIRAAAFQNFIFVHENQGYAAMPDGGSGKFVMPYQVAKTFGVV